MIFGLKTQHKNLSLQTNYYFAQRDALGWDMFGFQPKTLHHITQYYPI
jgi:hypothetical protein